MPPALDLQKFKKTTTAPKPTGTATQPLDLNSFKKVSPSNSADKPVRNISQMSGGFIRRTLGVAKEEAQKGFESIGKKADEFRAAPIAEKPLVAFSAPVKATGAAARVMFSPLTVAIGDAIEGISNMPEVQRIAMSDKVGKILDRAQDVNVKLGDFAKANPDLAGDIQDFVDTITLAVGPKAAKPVVSATARAGERVVEALPKPRVGGAPPGGGAGGMASRIAAERTLGAAEKEAGTILGRKVTDAITPDVAETFKKYGIEPPVSAVTGSRAIQGAEAYAQTSLVGGSRITQIIEKARQDIGKVAESLRRNVNPEKLKTAGVTSESVGKELQDALKKAKDSFDEAKTKVYDEATKQIGNQPALLNETRAALEDIIRQKRGSLDPSARAQVKYYEDLLRGTGDAKKRTYVNIKQTRTDIGKKLKNPTDPVTTGDRAALGRIYAALSDDLERTVLQSSKEAAAALKHANAFYKAGIEQINSVVGRTIFRSKSPETLVGKLITPGNVSAIRNLRTIVGADAFKQVGSIVMNDIIEKAISPLTGRLNPGKLAATIAKYGEDTLREVIGERGLRQLKDLRKASIVDDIIERGTVDGRVQPGRLQQAIEAYDDKVLKEAFTPEELAKLKDVQSMSAAMARGTRIAEGSQTVAYGQLGANIVLGTINLPSVIAKLGVEWGLTKLFSEPWGRKLLTRGRGGQSRGALESTTKNMNNAVPTPNSNPDIIPPTVGRTGAESKGTVTRYSERVENAPEGQNQAKPKRYEGKEAFGAAAGVQPDEEGNITINPLAAAAGMAGVGLGTKATKGVGKKFVDKFDTAAFFKKEPTSGFLDDMEQFVRMVSLKIEPKGYASKAMFEADIRDQAAKFGIPAYDMKNTALADLFGKILRDAEKAPPVQGRDAKGRFLSNQ